MRVRRARAEDREAVAAFTRDTWPDREVGDYVPDAFPEWVETDGERQRTFVMDSGDEGAGGDVAGVVQGTFLSEYETWTQGLRVDPAVRGRGVAIDLLRAVFAWACERGATVCRHMVFSWNAPSLGLSRTVGFDPVTEFRWVHPEPDPNPGAETDDRVTADPDGAWAFWERSDARSHLNGLALDPAETWALSSLTRGHLRDAADDGRLLAVQECGTRALAYRIRTDDREGDDGPETWAEYAVGAWTDVAAARALLTAVARDAASTGADETRVLIPERPRFVTDAAATRTPIADEPAFVFAADLTDESLTGDKYGD